jgi:hypothetical protein
MENEITKKEFKFKMNEYKDVIHVFIDSREKPVDSIHFMEHNDGGLDTMVSGWIVNPRQYMCCVTKSHNPCRLVVRMYNTKPIIVHGYILYSYVVIHTV